MSDPWAEFNPQAAPAQAPADPWAEFNPQHPLAPRDPGTGGIFETMARTSDANPELRAETEQAQSAMGRTLARGIPVAGAYIPHNEASAELAAKHPEAARFVEGAGGVLSTLPLAGIAAPGVLAELGLAGRALFQGGLQGSLTVADSAAHQNAAGQPVDWKAAGEQGLGVGALAGSFSAGGEAAARVIAPPVMDAARRLYNQGVELAPWQSVGGSAKWAADKMSGWPIVGENITAATQRSADSAMRNRLNWALEPLGKKLPKDMELNREAIEHVSDSISKHFQQHIPGSVGQLDEGFHAAVHDLERRAVGYSDPATGRFVRGDLPEPQAKQLEDIFDSQITRPFQGHYPDEHGLHIPGQIPGAVAQKTDIRLGEIGRGFASDQDFNNRELGRYVRELQDHFRDMVIRGSPAEASEGIRQAKQASARYIPIRDAAASLGADDGRFSVAQYKSALYNNTLTNEQLATRTGGADRVASQQFAEDAQSILPNKRPSSGTSERAQALEMAVALLAGHAIHPGIVAGATGGYLATTRPALNAATSYLMNAAPAVSAGLQKGLPLAAGQYGRENPDEMRALARMLGAKAGF